MRENIRDGHEFEALMHISDRMDRPWSRRCCGFFTHAANDFVPWIAFVTCCGLFGCGKHQRRVIDPPPVSRRESVRGPPPKLIASRFNSSTLMTPHLTGQNRRPPVSSFRYVSC